jgi:hypothetical protein
MATDGRRRECHNDVDERRRVAAGACRARWSGSTRSSSAQGRRGHGRTSRADTLACLLEDSLTPAERNIVRMNEHERLRIGQVFALEPQEPPRG